MKQKLNPFPSVRCGKDIFRPTTSDGTDFNSLSLEGLQEWLVKERFWARFWACHYVYRLLRKGEVVYYGTTRRPLAERAAEHRNETKDKPKKIFDHPEAISEPMSEFEAKEREKELLREFRIRNNGENPEYNLTDDG